MPKVEKIRAGVAAELTPEQYRVLRQKGTEAPFSGEYDHVFEPGTYRCAGCGATLFESDDEVRLRLRLAGVLRADRRGRDRRGDRHDATGWCAPRCCARAAAATSATSSPTARSRPGVRYCINSAALKLDEK